MRRTREFHSSLSDREILLICAGLAIGMALLAAVAWCVADGSLDRRNRRACRDRGGSILPLSSRDHNWRCVEVGPNETTGQYP